MLITGIVFAVVCVIMGVREVCIRFIDVSADGNMLFVNIGKIGFSFYSEFYDDEFDFSEFNVIQVAVDNNYDFIDLTFTLVGFKMVIGYYKGE
jgi:hypothetical protein